MIISPTIEDGSTVLGVPGERLAGCGAEVVAGSEWRRFHLATLVFPKQVLSGYVGRVVRVIDGDSIEVMHESRAEQVRLNGIDCPEMGQAFGRQAKQFTSEVAFGKEVNVRVSGHDRYGRTLGEVMLPDGRDLNRELVKAGYAWWFRRYAPNNRELAKLEKEAREARRGLWVDPNPVPPWEFRKSRRSVYQGMQ